MTNRIAILLAIAGGLAVADTAAAQNAGKQRVEGVVESIGYARAIQVGSTIYVSGLVGGGETVEQQQDQIYTQLAALLKPMGATLNDIVKETAYTTDIEALKAAIPARKRALGSHRPAATWVQIDRLYSPSAKLEVDFIVVAGSGN
jgi:enamine deaminase RidA (YjgF/YER057c/UK114 family)